MSEIPLQYGPGLAALEVGAFLKSTLAGKSAAELRALVTEQYVTMRLLGRDGTWLAAELEPEAVFLLPAQLGLEELHRLIDDGVRLSAHNAALTAFLQRAPQLELSALFEKVAAEGAQVLPQVVAYAFALDRLTRLLRADWRKLEACLNVWKQARAGTELWKQAGLFGRSKLLSMPRIIEQFIRFHKSGVVPPTYGRTLLPFNIAEVCLHELAKGHRDNVRAGWLLGKHRPGAEPTRHSQDGQAICFCMPRPEQWADLYTLWNLAFVSGYADFPFQMAKLLIPPVADHRDRPEEFIYTRTIALVAHLHYSFQRRADVVTQGKVLMNWRNETLTRAFGVASLASAEAYAAAVRTGP